MPEYEWASKILDLMVNTHFDSRTLHRQAIVVPFIHSGWVLYEAVLLEGRHEWTHEATYVSIGNTYHPHGARQSLFRGVLLPRMAGR